MPSAFTGRRTTFAPRLSTNAQAFATQGCSTWVVTISLRFPVRIRSYHTPLMTVLLPSVAHPLRKMSSRSLALMPA